MRLDTYRIRKAGIDLAARLGYRLTRIHAHDSGIDFLSAMIGLTAGRNRPLRIVQVGANDGNDHILGFAREFAAELLLIEANGELIEQLQANYAAIPHVTVVHAAVDPQQGSRDFHMVSPRLHRVYERRGQSHSGISSFDRAHVERHIEAFLGPRRRGDIITIQVPVRPLSDIVAEHGFGDADVLQIDTEGFDFEVLKSGGIDRWRPLAINMEFAHLSESDKAECLSLLHGLGYRTKLSVLDCMAFRG